MNLPSRRPLPAVALALAAMAAGSARAQHVDGYVELSGARTKETNQNAGFEPTYTDADIFVRRVNFNFAQRLFPNLQLLIGAFYEKEDVNGTVVDVPTDNERSQWRPYVRVRLTTLAFRGEAGFDRTEVRDSFSGEKSRNVRDTLAANAGWYPDAQNHVQVRYLHNEDTIEGESDERRTSASAYVDSFSRPATWLTLQYRSSYDVQNSDSPSSRTESNSTNFRVSYADTYWRTRLSLASDYNWTRSESRVRSTTGDPVDVRLFPTAGLSAIDDTPERDPLPPNPALIDGERAVGAGINLGLQPGDVRRRNFGVDLGIPVRVNVFRVWVDRDLRSEVAAAFSWEIWSSVDGDEWVFRRALASAPFDAFEDRFELAFEAISARYVKVVVRPLEPTDPFASEYPVIQVTELETFERVPPSEVSGSLARTNDRFTFNSRLRLLENEPFYYDLSYLRNTTEGSGTSTSLINGLTYSKTFSPVWALTARLSNERADQPGRDTYNSNLLSATVTSTPLPTLSTSLFVSGRQETIELIDRETYSVVLTSTAAIYRGVDVTAGLGGSRILQETGRTTEATLINVAAQITPNPAIAFGVILQDNSRTDRGGGLPTVEDPNRAAELTLTLNPVPTLYLYASRRVEKRTEFLVDGQSRRTLDNFSASWSPFPYGNLRLGFTWYETYDTQFDAVTTIWGPTLRWNFQPRSYLDVSYRKTENDSDLQFIDRDETFVTLHFGF